MPEGGEALEDKSLAKCQRALSELLETETVFVRHMRSLHDFFLEPLMRETRLRNSVAAAVFVSDTQILIELNGAFERELKKLVREKTSDAYEMVATSFSRFAKMFGPVYSMFAQHKHSFEQAVKSHNSARKLVSRIEQEEAETLQNQSLLSLLIMPIQRTPRYILLLDNVLNSLRKAGGSPSAEKALSAAMHEAKATASLVNECMRRDEQRERVAALAERFRRGSRRPQNSFVSKFSGGIFHADAPHRILVKEGLLRKRSRTGNTREYTFHLFNDVVTYSHVGVQPELEEGSAPLHLHRVMPLASLLVTVSQEDDQPVLKFQAPQKSFVAWAPSNVDTLSYLQEWQSEIQKTQSQLNQDVGRAASTYHAPVWTPDSAADSCDLCDRKWHLMRRRHHCRRCGRVVCGSCSSHRLLIAHVDVEKQVRVCDPCSTEVIAQEARTNVDQPSPADEQAPKNPEADSCETSSDFDDDELGFESSDDEPEFEEKKEIDLNELYDYVLEAQERASRMLRVGVECVLRPLYRELLKSEQKKRFTMFQKTKKDATEALEGAVDLSPQSLPPQLARYCCVSERLALLLRRLCRDLQRLSKENQEDSILRKFAQFGEILTNYAAATDSWHIRMARLFPAARVAMRRKALSDVLELGETHEALQKTPATYVLQAPFRFLDRVCKVFEIANKYAPTSEFPEVSIALSALENCRHKCRRAASFANEVEKLRELKPRFRGFDVLSPTVGEMAPLVTDGEDTLPRRLILEARLQKVCRRGPKTFGFYLFSDTLIYVDVISTLSESILNVHRVLPLRDMHVSLVGDIDSTDGSSANNSTATKWSENTSVLMTQTKAYLPQFQIRTPQKSFSVLCPSFSVRDVWYSALQKEIGSARNEYDAAANAPLWVLDQDAPACLLCDLTFTMFQRRHHCRQCGACVCNACSRQRRLLPAIHARKPQRVCDNCSGSNDGLLTCAQPPSLQSNTATQTQDTDTQVTGTQDTKANPTPTDTEGTPTGTEDTPTGTEETPAGTEDTGVEGMGFEDTDTESSSSVNAGAATALSGIDEAAATHSDERSDSGPNSRPDRARDEMM
ncbi:MAG: hypothetical protein MHM6MM_000252 [Cercozoa sp. M6MM]